MRKILLALSGLRTLTFPRHSSQKRKKNIKTISSKNAVRNQSTPVKTPSKILAKIKETYLYYTIIEFLPNKIASPVTTPKCWVQELHLTKNTQQLIVNPGDS